MTAQVALFIAMLFVALSAGLALGHALQWAPKRKLQAGTFVEVQQTFYVSYGAVAGLLQMGALAACVGLAVMVDVSSPAHGATVAALVLLGSMFLVWAILIRPINARVSAWRSDVAPADWTSIGVDKWHALHLVRLGLAVAALGCLVWVAIKGVGA